MCRAALIFFLAGLSAAEVGPPLDTLVREWRLAPFYRKHVSAGGIPVLASERVSDFALEEAAYVIDRMLGGRDDVRAAIVKNRVRLAVMAPDEFTTSIPEHSDLTPAKYWDKRARGLGASPIRPAVSCGEETLVSYRGDPYAAESILVHEFAHVIHQMGLNSVSPDFDGRLEATYRAALAKGLWQGTYAASNRHEFWAEGVQSWFDTNRENDNQHNHVNTREELKSYDPALAALISKELGDSAWRYRRPADRPPAERRHLEGFDPARSPEFAWPKDLLEWYENHVKRPGADKPDSVELTFAAPGEPAASRRSDDETSITFINRRAAPVTILWIDFDGNRRRYGAVAPGSEHRQHTFAGHGWLVVDEGGNPLGSFTAQSIEGRAVIE
jgi:hypothetical protein